MSSEDVETIWDYQLCNYSAMAALAFTVYDMIITIGQEYEHIWRGRWTNLKSFYLFLRWFSLIAQVIPTVITLKIVAGVIPESVTWCRLLLSIQALSSQIVMFAVQFILILRVRALYYPHTRLKQVLVAIYVAEVLTMFILFSVSARKISFGVFCSISSFPPTVVGYLLMPMTFETFLFGLTMYKFWQALREGWRQESVLTRLTRDGIWAFALPFTIFLINYLTMALKPGPLVCSVRWILAIPSFCGYRLILNMSHLLRPPSSSSTGRTSTTLRTSGNLDTLLWTRPTNTQYDTMLDTFSSSRS